MSSTPRSFIRPPTLHVLCIHGAGHQETSTSWRNWWKDAIRQGIQQAHAPLPIDFEFRFTDYDDIFQPAIAHLSSRDILQAIIKLGGGLFLRTRAFPTLADRARWTAGMVVAWAENEPVRDAARQKFMQDVDEFGPDLICAHSLGSLIGYDGFRRQEEKIRGRTYLTFGSQLGNPFIRGAFGGEVKPFVSASCWRHVYNPHDHVFTAPLDFGTFRTAANFRQVVALFGDSFGLSLNHDAVNPANPEHAYLTNSQTLAQVWPGIAPPLPADAPERE